MAQSKYLRRVDIRRQDPEYVNRGWDIGSKIGTSLTKAIGDYQKNALANKLMTDEAISEQPGAGVTQDLGKLPGGDDASASQDLGALPPEKTFTNPSTGNVEPIQGQDSSDLAQAIAQSRAQSSLSSPTVGSIGESTPANTDFSLNNLAPSGPANTQTVGGLMHTGGTQEMELRKEMLEQQLRKAELAKKIAEAAGTGRYARRATPAPQGMTVSGGSSSRWLQGGGSEQGGQGKGSKPPAYQPGSGDVENDESTDSFNQIRADFDDQHGKGTFDKFQAQSGGTKNDDGSYSIMGSGDKPAATVQAADVPIWMQRVNAARVKHNQAPVGSLGDGQNPGSNAPVGTATNPVIATSKVHVRSLPFGTVIYDPNTGQTYRKQRPSS